MTELAFVIHEIPVTKKNSQQILINRVTHRPFVMPSVAYKRFEEAAGKYLLPSRGKAVTEPVNVLYRFYMPSRRRVDLANLISAMDDVLVRWKVLDDDNRDIIAAHDGSRVYYDKDAPRVEILITPMEGYKQWGTEQSKKYTGGKGPC